MVTVRHSLLAILDQGPCYGYQLRSEFERRTGQAWPLNVGQVYTTLDRLERDKLVVKGATDSEGHVHYAITEAGSAEVAAWMSAPGDRDRGTRNALAIKLALAATLPGVDVTAMIAAQRHASVQRLHELKRATYPGTSTAGPEELAWLLVTDSMIFDAEAEVRWLEHAEQRLGSHPARALELSTDRPKRGRPVRAAQHTSESH